MVSLCTSLNMDVQKQLVITLVEFLVRMTAVAVLSN